MDLRKLEYLEAIYRLKSFTRAAEEQYVSQSSISEAIMRLEEEMGATFIVRGTKPVTFTPAGKTFMQFVYPILNMMKTAQEEVSLTASQAQAEISFAWASKYDDRILYRLLEEFSEEFPQYMLLPHEGTSAQMLEQVRQEKIEFAYLLIPQDIDSSAFDTLPVQCSTLSAAVSRNNPLSSKKVLPLEALDGEKVYIPPKGARLRTAFDTLYHARGLTARKFQVIPPFQVQRLMAKRNSGIYLTTRDDFGETDHDPDFVVIPIEDAAIFSKGIITKKGRILSSGAQMALIRINEIIQRYRIGL